MKKKLSISVCLMLLLGVTVFSQVSSLGFNYSAMLRDSLGKIKKSQSVQLRFSLLPNQSSTTPTWQETQTSITDAFGFINLNIGNGTKVGGTASSFATVDFTTANYWLQVDMMQNNAWQNISLQALNAVPYAKVAGNAVSAPIGTVMAFAGPIAKVPAGWLVCDGSAVSMTTYAALYATIGSSWGNGDALTTFNVPDMRGMFLRGVNSGSSKDPDVSIRTAINKGGNTGDNVGSIQPDQLKTHSHKFGGMIGTSNGGGYPVSYGDGTSWTTATDGGLETRPVNVYVYYIIKY